jgi:hypothetical protein
VNNPRQPATVGAINCDGEFSRLQTTPRAAADDSAIPQQPRSSHGRSAGLRSAEHLDLDGRWLLEHCSRFVQAAVRAFSSNFSITQCDAIWA